MRRGTQRSYKGRGVVLHTIKYSENAIVVHLLTDVGGRQSFIVQGVRSGKGRGSKAALFQPLFTLEFEGVASSRGELHRFSEVRSALVLRRTPFDIRRSAIALFIAEVLYRLVKESAPNSALFERVWCAIEALDTIEDGVANFHIWFLANLSRDLGFMPSGSYEDGMWLDIREGAYVAHQPHSDVAIAPRDAALFATMLGCSVTELGSVALSRNDRVSLLEALLHYYGYHLDTIYSVQSLTILRELF